MFARLFTATLVLVALGEPAFAQIGKDAKLLGPFKPVVARANESTVRVRCDDRDTILGTVVAEDGYILTKASELRGAVSVKFSDGTVFEAVTVASHVPTDLALLKVDVKGLKAVTFAPTEKVPQGNWLAAAGPTSDPLSVGIVSVMTRKLTGFMDTSTVARNLKSGALGVFPADEKDDDGNPLGAKLTDVPTTGAAYKAGLRANDIIVEMDGKPIRTQEDLRGYLNDKRPGDVVAVKAKRKDETKDFKVTLAARERDRGDIQNAMGSELSSRRTGFPLVLQTDLVIDAKDCGGPVVDLDGNVLGINIARAGRVETWVLPSEVINPLLPDFKAGKFAPVTKKAEPKKDEPKK